MDRKHTDQEILDAYEKCDTYSKAAELLGVDRRNYTRRLKLLLNERGELDEDAHAQNASLRAELLKAQKGLMSDRAIRREIMGLAEHSPAPPKWLVRKGKASKSPGVPTLFASDWHWGEVVNPDEVGGVNEYNLDIAKTRARKMVERAIDLLTNHMTNPDYPGIVFPLGGDMVSGDIHEELSATNELEIMPTVIDLFDTLIWCIDSLAETFGKVFVPCVTGNHGRNTKKIRAKGRNHTSFDWLLYTMLERHYADNKNISFLVAGGPDALYRVYNHRYLLTHGDQFRGGDGMIGALGPILRGDHKKRSRNQQVDMSYDTMLLGHWHQLIQLQRVIVNGSLKGYDEYAWASNFPFEPPKQGLWMTHPEHGITFSMPVHLVDSESKESSPWVSVKA